MTRSPLRKRLPRASRSVRLVILGEGKGRARLVAPAETLGIAGDVELPGYVDNPFPYMARSAVFVLSSAWEGFGNVLAEAMACRCPVVSTDCPAGPAEILDGGVYGPLVPVGDAVALAMAIESVLDSPPERERATIAPIARRSGISRCCSGLPAPLRPANSRQGGVAQG